MQDRFKFRIWDETEKNMVYFDGIFYNKKPYTEGSSFPQYESSPHYHKLSDLMQSTGFKDENGKLIYEGDIVQIFHVSGTMQGSCFFGVVKWNNSRTGFYVEKYGTIYDDDVYKVIGNIYENPELKEVEYDE